MYDIILKQNCGYKWHTEETLYAKGYIYYNNRIMSAIDFYKINKNNIKEIIKNVDGQFVIIDKCENIITIITDKSNSFPIYIDTSNKIIFDSYNKFNSTYTFSKEDCHDFLSMSRCFPGRTLIKNIFVSQCSSIYSIDKKSIIKKKYFKFERFTEDPTTFFDSLYSYIETYCLFYIF